MIVLTFVVLACSGLSEEELEAQFKEDLAGVIEKMVAVGFTSGLCGVDEPIADVERKLESAKSPKDFKQGD